MGQFWVQINKERNESEICYLDYGEGKQWRKDDGNLSREAAKLFKEMEYPAIKPFHEGFRSTLITHMLVNGVPITTVQQLADHSSIKTTESYLDRRRIQQEQAVEALNNINKPLSD
jgi:integrase